MLLRLTLIVCVPLTVNGTVPVAGLAVGATQIFNVPSEAGSSVNVTVVSPAPAITLTVRFGRLSVPGTIGLMPCEFVVGTAPIEATFVPAMTPSVMLTWVPARTLPRIWQLPAVRPSEPVTAVGPAGPLEVTEKGKGVVG